MSLTMKDCLAKRKMNTNYKFCRNIEIVISMFQSSLSVIVSAFVYFELNLLVIGLVARKDLKRMFVII